MRLISAIIARWTHALVLPLALIASTARAQAPGAAGMLVKTVVTVDGDRNGLFEVGENVEYTLVFTNSGSSDLTNVVVEDLSSSCIALDTNTVAITPIGGGSDVSGANDVRVDIRSPIGPSETVTITFTGVTLAEGQCCNQATWTSTEVVGGVSDRDPTDLSPDEPTCHSAVPDAPGRYDATVDKQVLAGGCLAPGSTVEFRIRASNTGDRPLRNAWIEDLLDPAFSNVVPGAGLSYDLATNRLYTSPGTYGVGETTEFAYTAELPCTANGSVLNTARFSFETAEGLPFTRTDTETITWGLPDLTSSSKSWMDDPDDGDRFISVGEVVTFSITVANTGTCNALNVEVTDTLDPRFLSGVPAPLVIGQGGTYDPATGIITWSGISTTELASIPVDGVVVLTFQTQVDPATAEGQFIPNSALISPLGNDSSACPGLPSLNVTVGIPGDGVQYGSLQSTERLLRNGFISVLAGAFETMRGSRPTPGLQPILIERGSPQECSAPPAINDLHPQTSAFRDPIPPHVSAGDGIFRGERRPQAATGDNRVLVFYELENSCTEALRVAKSASLADVVISW